MPDETQQTGAGANRRRASDGERASREAEALALLANGAGTALAAQTLAASHGISVRQARRYVANAALELCEPLTPLALDSEASVTLHRMSLLAGQAMAAGDRNLALRASRAQAAAIAQLRRAITAPVTRFRLPATRAAPPEPAEPGGPLPLDCPF